MIRREGPAGVEQHCPEPTFCSAWSLELSPQPQLIPCRRAQRAGSACRTKLCQKTPVHKRLHQGGADGALSLSFPSLSLSFSLFTPDLHHPRDQTNLASTGYSDIPSFSSLPSFVSSFTLPGNSMAVLFYSILSPEVCCGSGELVAVCWGL